METKRGRQLFVVIVTLIASMLACNFGSEPTVEVTIESPEDGATVNVGEAVEILSNAKASAGVVRVELWVDGEVERMDEPPTENPTEFRVVQPWTPETSGEVTLSTVAYDGEGNISSPAIISVQVVGESVTEGTPTPFTPEPTEEEPTSEPTEEEPTSEPTVEDECTLDASFVSDVSIPDGTEVDPGASFVKIWRVRNTGTCAWEGGFQLLYTSGDQLGGPAFINLPVVAPGQEVDLSVDLTAPVAPGTYQGEWRLRSAEGEIFGTNLIVEIVVPAPPTDTPTPTATSFTVLTVRPITLIPMLPYTELVHEQISINSGAVGSATATCPSGSLVVSGGFATNPDVLVYTHSRNGNGWRVYAKNNTGSSKLLNVYATCLHNASGASITQVFQSAIAAAGGIGHPVAACPAGSIVTGGGWASPSGGSLWVYNSSKSGNGWQVYAKNSSGSGKQVNAYAICLSGVSGSTEQLMQSTSIAAGSTGNAITTCGSNKLITGGGFASQDDLVMYNTSPYFTGTNQWRTYAQNNGSENRTMYGYAVCLSFP